jgi:beta-1,4-mannosyl-glycoprotein beta-1,4-N-acetylglucosaminyltransferase
MFKRLILILALFMSATTFGKVYDCFMFNNELEVLEIRLNEMSPYVDYFVLVEWNRGHRKSNLKPFYFEENKHKFEKFLPKIIHIKLDEVIETDDPWVRENYHRNQIMRGLVNCSPEDVILISDADEFIPGKLIPQLSVTLDRVGRLGFWQTLYRWYLNRTDQTVWSGTFAIKYRELIKTTPQHLRNEFRGIENLPRWRAGWHFTSMGGYEKTKEKYYDIVEGADAYFPTKEEWYRHVVESTVRVPVDVSFPKFIRQNQKNLIEKDLIDNR